jgi:hypothetical protein
LNKENKKKLLQEIMDEGLVERDDNSGGMMEKNEFRKLQVLVKCTEDVKISINHLSDQIQESTNINNSLSKRIYCLNFILAVATLVIAVGSVITIYFEYFIG